MRRHREVDPQVSLAERATWDINYAIERNRPDLVAELVDAYYRDSFAALTAEAAARDAS